MERKVTVEAGTLTDTQIRDRLQILLLILSGFGELFNFYFPEIIGKPQLADLLQYQVNVWRAF